MKPLNLSHEEIEKLVRDSVRRQAPGIRVRIKNPGSGFRGRTGTILSYSPDSTLPYDVKFDVKPHSKITSAVFEGAELEVIK
jgi:hypothetical protein